ncbi:cytochrome c [Sulfitobacter sp.]|uniref:cytochrome c n=1 Tax=Sulfitobacter sp. TaxID=1903071 RepID=UPI003EF52F2A
MFRTLFRLIVAFGVVGLLGFLIYAYRPSIEPLSADAVQEFDAELVAKGEVLAAAGYCSNCHTVDGEPAYAGNYAMETGFGTIYSTNITPDPEMGIGNWSREAFARAMQDGVDREGKHLFPAFPYDHFTKMTDEDVDALYAYIMTEIPPAQVAQKENELPFPLNLRVLQAGWKMLFVDFGRYEADAEKSDEWNRGAYLVEGLTHCGACHTPRNPLGAEISSEQYQGAAIDQWIAPALTSASPAALGWTAEDFSSYLKDGATVSHGVAAGPMGPVVHAGLRELPDSDLAAIGVYLADVGGAPEATEDTADIIAASLEAGRPDQQYRRDLGERLYATGCASCHYNVEQIALGRPDLGINSAVRLSEPDNLIHVILNGVGNEEGISGVVMPGFRDAFDDTEVAAIAAYLRASRTSNAPWAELETKIEDIRAAK